MKVLLKREKNNLFFAKIKGISGVYAQGDSMQTAISNLMEVYQQVVDFKKNQLQHTQSLDRLYQQAHTLNKLSFTHMEFAI